MWVIGVDVEKLKYNALLLRYAKAEIYMENPKILMDAKLKFVPELVKLTFELSTLLDAIGAYTDVEALNGFYIGESERVA